MRLLVAHYFCKAAPAGYSNQALLANEQNRPGKNVLLGRNSGLGADSIMPEQPVEGLVVSELSWPPTSLVIDLTKAAACGSQCLALALMARCSEPWEISCALAHAVRSAAKLGQRRGSHT